jgi:hypothetical protein
MSDRLDRWGLLVCPVILVLADDLVSVGKMELRDVTVKTASQGVMPVASMIHSPVKSHGCGLKFLTSNKDDEHLSCDRMVEKSTESHTVLTKRSCWMLRP